MLVTCLVPGVLAIVLVRLVLINLIKMAASYTSFSIGLKLFADHYLIQNFLLPASMKSMTADPIRASEGSQF